jgi:hypothetical protein
MMICQDCGAQGTPKSHTRGSILIELVLWLLFIIPGLLYSLWRLSTPDLLRATRANSSQNRCDIGIETFSCHDLNPSKISLVHVDPALACERKKRTISADASGPLLSV